jgi:hypothetical protein
MLEWLIHHVTYVGQWLIHYVTYVGLANLLRHVCWTVANSLRHVCWTVANHYVTYVGQWLIITSRMLDGGPGQYTYTCLVPRGKGQLRNSACVMEPVYSLPYSQQPITEPYPVPDSSNRIPMAQFI